MNEKSISIVIMMSWIICTSATVCTSQKKWKLQECIDYAIKNNVQLRRLRLNADIAQLSWDNAKHSRYPSLSSSASQNFSLGRSLSYDNTYVNQNVNNTSFAISTDIPLFTGFRIPNTIKLNMLNYLASKSDVEKMENLLCIDIFEAYTQILLCKENLYISKYQVELDSIQYESAKALEQVGRLSYIDVSRQNALLSQSRMSYTQSLTNFRSSLLAMTQLLNLSSVDGFDVADSLQGNVYDAIDNPHEVYQKALASRPEVVAEKYRAEAARKAVAVAKSYRYPQLSLSGGLNTHYYYSSHADNNTFSSQLKNNFSQSISINLSIPIFNRFETRNGIKRAEIESKSQMLTLENTESELYQTIQQAYNNAINAQMNYQACCDAVTSCKDAFTLVTSKYNSGRVNAVEYSDIKSKYIESKCKLLQAKYQLLFAVKKLKFYGGESLNVM